MKTLSFISQIFPVVIGLSVFTAIKKNRNESLLVFLYCLLSLVFEVIEKLLFKLNGSHNIFLFHLFTLFEFQILIIVLFRFSSIKWKMKFGIAVSAAFFVIWVILKIFIEPFNEFDKYSSLLSSMTLATFSYADLLQGVQKRKIEDQFNSRLWFLLSVFIYHSLNISSFLLFNQTIYEQIWLYHSAVNIVSQILLGIYFVKYYLETKQKEFVELRRKERVGKSLFLIDTLGLLNRKSSFVTKRIPQKILMQIFSPGK